MKINGEEVSIREPTWGEFNDWLCAAEISNGNVKEGVFYDLATKVLIDKSPEWIHKLPLLEGKKLRQEVVKKIKDIESEDDIKK